ncbi:hypothetical protein [Streptomyces sp. NPDC000410]|uniref:hypothetical protein n=1 Tax=Streptomyces sp. NPDC000410 TaxID=3154254 RepID=UPI003316DF87
MSVPPLRSTSRLRERVRARRGECTTPAASLAPRPPDVHLLLAPDSPEAAREAVRSGVDAVVLDLYGDDGSGQDLAMAWACARTVQIARAGAGRSRSPQLRLRVNPAGTAACEDELAQLAGMCEGLILPEVRSADDVQWVAKRAPAVRIVPVIENAEGLSRAASISSHPAVSRLGYSAAGFTRRARRAGEAGTEAVGLLLSAEVRQWQRGIMIAAAVAAGLPGPVNGIGTARAKAGLDAYAEDAAPARSAGFTGQCANSPAQLARLSRLWGPAAAPPPHREAG